MKPVVALESTVITHGLPRPVNLEAALEMTESVRQEGAEPRMIAFVRGQPRIGLDRETLKALATRTQVRKCGLRDLPLMRSTGEWGGTTVSATLHLAHQAGIAVFATGGIGGVHRGGGGDVSTDLSALASIPGTVVCSGAKSILDLLRTRERLETDGVTVLGMGTDELPAFTSRESGLSVDHRVETPEEVAEIMLERDALGLHPSILVTVPCPKEAAIGREEMESALTEIEQKAAEQGVQGRDLTPFLLAGLADRTDGRTLIANRALLCNNAEVAARIAIAFSALSS